MEKHHSDFWIHGCTKHKLHTLMLSLMLLRVITMYVIYYLIIYLLNFFLNMYLTIFIAWMLRNYRMESSTRMGSRMFLSLFLFSYYSLFYFIQPLALLFWIFINLLQRSPAWEHPIMLFYLNLFNNYASL